METFYLINYLRDTKFRDSPALIDSLAYEIDKKINYYGHHFKTPQEDHELANTVKLFLERHLVSLCFRFRKNQKTKNLLVSNAYFNFNDELRKLGFDVERPHWNYNLRSIFNSNDILNFNFEIVSRTYDLKSEFLFKDLTSLISDETIDRIEEYKAQVSAFYLKSRLKGLVVPNDLSFFENINIKICRNLGIPSFVSLHGLPARYNGTDDNRADYLLVWGNRIKEGYVNAGVNADKIIVTGHPMYSSRSSGYRSLRFSLENILVASKATNGANANSHTSILQDRGNLILYLLRIQRILYMSGVRRVRLRLHPSQNPQWIYKNIDSSFFIPDFDSLDESLKKATLVIGPSSTLLVDSLNHGVNYILFEPSIDGRDIVNHQLVHPFDGSDLRVPVAKNDSELLELIKNRVEIDQSFLTDYISPNFDINFITTLCK